MFKRLLPVLAATGAVFALAAPVGAQSAPPAKTYAIIGDTPYAADQTNGNFPLLITAINSDPAVTGVAHLGDFKNGSTTCSDAYFFTMKGWFDAFIDSLVYTPGDNEWTDCHRANNGAFDPQERLAKVRSTFFAVPGRSLGQHPRALTSQVSFPENVLWNDCGVTWAAVHVVGSLNSRLGWTTAGDFPDNPATRIAEADAREAAGLAWVDAAFDTAIANNSAGVVLLTQADTTDVVGTQTAALLQNAFETTMNKIAARAAAFNKPVLLFQGDSHVFTVSPSFLPNAVYPSATPAPKLTRIIVTGQTTQEYLRLKCDPSTATVFSYERVPVNLLEVPAVAVTPTIVLAGSVVGALGLVSVARRRRTTKAINHN